MNIENILPLITYICTYYYDSYYNKILNYSVNIPDKIVPALMNRIYSDYVKIYETEYVHDICIFPGNLVYNKTYVLDEQCPSIEDIIQDIDFFMDNHDFYSENIIPINVINISDLPISNGITYTNEWIKQFIDVYRF